jgi:hypothetical protein
MRPDRSENLISLPFYPGFVAIVYKTTPPSGDTINHRYETVYSGKKLLGKMNCFCLFGKVSQRRSLQIILCFCNNVLLSDKSENKRVVRAP